MEAAFSAASGCSGGEETSLRVGVEESYGTFIPCGHKHRFPDFLFFFFFLDVSLQKPYTVMEVGKNWTCEQ